ncbi:MAG: hypothetical protein ISS72_06845 [Candidatus Brocadiae bacterium]|nr:hypothetical protein [Candidatus Brocadiia bacterium]
MTVPTKIDFRYRRVSQFEDITDLVETLFPGNRNQQHAAARILLALKMSREPVASLSHLEQKHGISRRTMQRTRAKLTRLGLIEHVTWMNSRYGGQQGWRLSSRMSSALRRLADWVDEWRKDARPGRMEKDALLVGVLG